MKIKCITASAKNLPSKLKRFAFTQDQEGNVDLTEGKIYNVYGERKNQYGIFYLTLTDTDNDKLPWWMPAYFFEVTDTTVPESWKKKSWGWIRKETIVSHPAYFDAIDAIEDGTPKGYAAFKKMKNIT